MKAEYFMQTFQNLNSKGSTTALVSKALLIIIVYWWFTFAGRGGRRHDGARALEAWPLQGVQNQEGGGDARQNGGERKVNIITNATLSVRQ